MKQLFSFFLLLFTLTSSAQTVQDNMWVTNGTVRAVQRAGNTVYIGGNFTKVGPHIPGGVAIDAATGNPDVSYPKLNGSVSTVVPDGAGGWYIGGNFTQVGGQPRNRLARINADGSLHPWNPDANSYVTTIVVVGSTVYVGGNFTHIGGQVRNRIAALDAATGAVTAWNPDANQTVHALAVAGNIVYVGGSFSNIGGQVRRYIAALDAVTGTAMTWNPNGRYSGISYSGVFTIAIAGSTVYVGGRFQNIGGQARNHIAALDAATGTATAWNPNVTASNNGVYTLVVTDGTVYAGGWFSNIGGQNRNNIAALNASTGLATDWNPDAGFSSFGSVNTLAVTNGTVYVGGQFTNIGGQDRNHIAAIDVITGAATDWNPDANEWVSTLAVDGSTIYVGGGFTSIGDEQLDRNNIAALNATTGVPTAWNPDADNWVLTLAVDGSTLYAGGRFENIGGQARNRIAAIDATTGVATAWDPDADHEVLTLEVNSSTLYAGGRFENIGGQARNRIAAIDATTGTATIWNPDANGVVWTLAVDDGTVYVGGGFTTIGGQARNRIAAIDATGIATLWDPSASGTVRTLAVTGSTVYAGGMFVNIGGQTRRNIAALDAATGAATVWNPNANNLVLTLAVDGSTVYVGGEFTNIGGQSRNSMAALDAATGDATAWNAGLVGIDASVQALAVSGNTTYVGGVFHGIAQQLRRGFAALSTTDGIPDCPGEEPLTLSFTTSGVCTGYEPQATITAIASGSAAPLVYALLLSDNPDEPDESFEYVDEPVFSVSEFGTYQLRVRDACGSYLTRQVEIHPASPRARVAQGLSNTLYQPDPLPENCDKLRGVLNLVNDETGAPLGISGGVKYLLEVWEHIDGCPADFTYKEEPDWSKEMTHNDDRVTFFNANSNAFSWRLTSGCGEVTTGCNTKTPITPAVSSMRFFQPCTDKGATVVVVTNSNARPYTLHVTAYDAGNNVIGEYSGEQDDLLFTDIPPAHHYEASFKDRCGDVFEFTRSYESADPAVTISYSGDCAAVPGTRNVIISNFRGNIPGFGTTSPGPGNRFTLRHAVTGTIYETDPEYAAENPYWLRVRFASIPPGDYLLSVLGEPGACITEIPVTVTEPDPSTVPIFDLDGSVTQTCSGTGTITAQIVTNLAGGLSYRLIDTATGATITTNSSGVFPNLSAGAYTVSVARSYCEGTLLSTKDFTILPTGADPWIVTNIGINCDNGTTGVAGLVFLGTAPFELEMKKTTEGDAAWAVIDAAAPNERLVTGLDPNTHYNVRVTDGCGNRTVAVVSVGPLAQVPRLTEEHPCIGEPYALELADIPGAVYSWRRQGSTTPISSSHKLEWAAYAAGDNGTYECIVTIGDCITRTETIALNSELCGGALPVRWISFEGRLDEQNLATLDWATEESNVSHYEVERSRNARDFHAIATVPAHGDGAGRYRFTDPTAVLGHIYYRIRQVDRDGTFSHSRIISLHMQSQAVLKAYPNPARRSIVVELGAGLVGSRARLVSTAGVVLQEFTVKEPVFSIPLQGYPAGIYLLHTEDGKVVKVVKE